MEWEHSQSWYAQAHLKCWYVDGGTTAKAEYDYVCGPAVECICNNGLRDAGHGSWTLQQLMDNNADLIEKAGLQLAEVMALRLYTGNITLCVSIACLRAVQHLFYFSFAQVPCMCGITACSVSAKAPLVQIRWGTSLLGRMNTPPMRYPSSPRCTCSTLPF
jgi:hypothetical protein